MNQRPRRNRKSISIRRMVQETNLTISDFDITKDKFIFKVAANKVSVNSNVITVDNDDPLGDYLITLSNSPDLSNLANFSTFA